MRNSPVIGVSACLQQGPRSLQHIVRIQYVDAVLDGMGGVPLLLPAVGARQQAEAVLDRIDGLLLTGSPSNVEPRHYGAASREGTLHDPARDATTLPLIRAALARGLPVLALCRGHQELNVALGGSLHQHVEEMPGRINHQAPSEGTMDERYVQRHWVDLVPGGFLRSLAGTGRAWVNSLHNQAIDRLGEGLAVEATHEDGTIESVRWTKGPGFALGLQWHPEWHVRTDAFSKAIFRAFGEAIEKRKA
ncbi:MAG: gamma-glutamyl-gamma-aminobutyrate hydrolase family protein [Alphaproteobacteria bacterium]|nr:gamma-glutamyl-gamma-aminobutyrate hydrolase family protein [Alphaproteobacteria bacterium]